MDQDMANSNPTTPAGAHPGPADLAWLAALTRVLTRPVSLSALIHTALAELATATGLPHLSLLLFDHRALPRSRFFDLVSPSQLRFTRPGINLPNDNPCQQLSQVTTPAICTASSNGSFWRAFQALVPSRPVHTLWLVPIPGIGSTLGLLSGDTADPNTSSTANLHTLLQIVANLLAPHLIRLQTPDPLDEIQTGSGGLTLTAEQNFNLLDTLSRAVATLETDALLQTAVSRLGSLSGADGCYIALWDEERQLTVPYLAYGLGDENYQQNVVIEHEPTLTESVLQLGHSLIINDVHNSPYISPRIANLFPSISALVLPLINGDEKLGAIIVGFSQPHVFTPAEINVYEHISRQISLALSKARLFAATRRQLEELQVLQAVAQAGAEATSEDSLIERATQIIGNTFFPNNFGILLLDTNMQQLIPHHSYRGDRPGPARIVQLDEGICGWVASTGQSLRVPHVSQDSRYLVVDPNTRSELCVPLRVDDRQLGVVNAESQQPDAFTEADERLMTTLASQLATAMKKIRLLEAERARRQEAEAMREAARKNAQDLAAMSDILNHLNSKPNVTDAFPAVAEGIRLIAGCQLVYLTLIDRQTAQCSVLVTSPPDTLLEAAGPPAAAIEGEPSILDGQPVFVPDLTRQPPRPGREQQLLRLGYPSLLSLPMAAGSQIIGALNLAWQAPGAEDIPQLALLEQIATSVALAVERSRLFAETNRYTNELKALTELSSELRTASTIAEMLPIIVKKSLEAVNNQSGAILLVDPTTDELVVSSVYPAQLNHMLGVRYQLGQGISGRIAKTKEPYTTSDLTKDPNSALTNQQIDEIGDLMPRSLLSIPLQTQERLVGIMHVVSSSERVYSAEEVRLLNAIGEIASSAIYRATVLTTLEQRVGERTSELAAANARLTELDRLKSKFVSDVSHELRTPITNLNLYLDLLEQGKAEKRNHYWAVLRKQTERLQSLIEDILSLSRLEIAKDRLSFEPVDLNHLVEQVVAAHRAQAQLRQIDLQFSPGRDLPLIEGAANHLSQVITNLVANGMNYTPAGVVHITTGHQPHKNCVYLAVHDTGMGIEPSDMPHLFERFYRGTNASETNIPGTGLGLAIVQEIVQLHRGRIEVDSQPGQGATFTVWLPLVQQPAS